jgi:hypothetical protein
MVSTLACGNSRLTSQMTQYYFIENDEQPGVSRLRGLRRLVYRIKRWPLLPSSQLISENIWWLLSNSTENHNITILSACQIYCYRSFVRILENLNQFHHLATL